MSLDAESVTEAIRQATHVLADSSRGGAVVDQIPYVPAESVDNFDKIVIGSAACVLAYAWAAYEFGKVNIAWCLTSSFRRNLKRVYERKLT